MGEARLALLSLGANHEADVNLPRAAGRIASVCEVVGVSGVYETPPISGVGANYLNAALAVKSALGEDELRATFKAIERELGRRPAPHPAPHANAATVPIDIDVCVIPPLAASSDTLRVGHLAALLAEVAPELAHPTTGEPLAVIAERLGDGAAMTRRPDVDAALKSALAG